MKPLDDNDYALIEKFANDELTDDDKALFNEKMTNATFSNEVRLYQETARSVDEVYNDELRHTLRKHLPEDLYSEKAGNRKRRRHFYWAAAAIAIFVISVAGLLVVNERSENYFDSYFKPFPAPIVTRATKSTDPFENIRQSYAAGNCSQSLPSLVQLLNRESDPQQQGYLHLMAGSCLLQLNRIGEARNHFKAAISNGDSEIEQHGTWYYALTLVKSNQYDSSLVALDQVTRTSRIYRHQARELAEAIRDSKN